MRVTDKYILFYTEWPSNFAKANFTWTAFNETHNFFCTEQAYHWAKAMYFHDNNAVKEILSTEAEGNTPMWCKQCGRWTEGYIEEEWAKVRYEFMFQVNIAKYTQNENLKKKLLNPEYDDKIFVEASPTDKIWGIGRAVDDPKADDEKHWHGTNLLGKCLTDVRKALLLSKEN